MDFSEITEKTGFWILGGFGTAAILVGWIMGRKWGLESFSIWNILIMILVAWGASAFFASRE